MSERKETIKSRLRGVYEFLCKIRVITLLLTALPGGIISFAGIMPNIKIFEKFYEIIDGTRYLKSSVCIAMLIMCSLGFFASLIWTIFSNDDNYNVKRRMQIYKALKEAESIYGKKYHDNFLDVINEEKYAGDVEKALKAVTDNASRLNPEYRLKSMVLSIKDILCKVFGLSSDELTINLIHKRENSDKWETLASYNNKDNDKTIKQLMSSSNSAYCTALRLPSKQILCISKEDGVRKGVYIPTPEEEEFGVSGSIYCRNLSIYDEDGNMLRGFLLAIATYKKEFGEPYDPYVVNICLELFSDIINFIKPEIATICLNENINVEEYIHAKEKTTEIKVEEKIIDTVKHIFSQKK